MNFKLLLATFALFFGALTSSFATTTASFPVQQTVQELSTADEIKNEVKAMISSPSAASGKSQLTALLLAIFVGSIGIHRFYLGYTWQGVVQLLTFGACGIWSLIDLIRIITGDLKPKNGGYSKTL